MSRLLRRAVAVAIGTLPTAALRRLCYNRLLGYRVHRTATVGPFSLIDVTSLELGPESVLERGSVFAGPLQVRIGRGSSIGCKNEFRGGHWSASIPQGEVIYAHTISIGDYCRIAPCHFFDVNGTIEVGDYTWIAGRGSQFWTHGAGKLATNVRIGAHCFIGSACRFAPGAAIPDHCVVSLGSVVTRRFKNEYMLLGGQPCTEIKDIREDIEERRLNWGFDLRQVETVAVRTAMPHANSELEPLTLAREGQREGSAS